MYVPVDTGAVIEFRVDRGKDIGTEQRGDKRLDGLVEDEGEEDLMDVIGQSSEGDGVSEGFDEVED